MLSPPPAFRRVNKIPVIIEVDLKKLTSRGAQADITMNREMFQQAIVDRGLRGQLEMESLVTGLLFVALDFLPGTPMNLVQQAGGDYEYPELPTVPTTLEQARGALFRIIDKLEDIDLKGLEANLQATLKGVNRTEKILGLSNHKRKNLQKLICLIDTFCICSSCVKRVCRSVFKREYI
jgi:paraquat-inducible protein B